MLKWFFRRELRGLIMFKILELSSYMPQQQRPKIDLLYERSLGFKLNCIQGPVWRIVGCFLSGSNSFAGLRSERLLRANKAGSRRRRRRSTRVVKVATDADETGNGTRDTRRSGVETPTRTPTRAASHRPASSWRPSTTRRRWASAKRRRSSSRSRSARSSRRRWPRWRQLWRHQFRKRRHDCLKVRRGPWRSRCRCSTPSTPSPSSTRRPTAASLRSTAVLGKSHRLQCNTFCRILVALTCWLKGKLVVVPLLTLSCFSK